MRASDRVSTRIKDTSASFVVFAIFPSFAGFRQLSISNPIQSFNYGLKPYPDQKYDTMKQQLSIPVLLQITPVDCVK